MREIIFRGKQTVDEEWLEGDLRHWRKGTIGIHSDITCNTIPVIPETIGQYTGLKDKNGQRMAGHGHG